MSDKIVDFEEYQKLKKESRSKTTAQDEIKKILESTKPLSKRDILQLELIESLAEHVHYLTKLIENLLEENKELKAKINPPD